MQFKSVHTGMVNPTDSVQVDAILKNCWQPFKSKSHFDLPFGYVSHTYPPLAQLVRASSLYLEGPWFESKGADKRKQKTSV